MYNLIPLILLFTSLGCSSNSDSIEVKQFYAYGDSLCVTGVLEIPNTKGPHPAVVILHGSAGLDQRYIRLAKSLADSGFVALALDYYAEVGSSAIMTEEKLKKWPKYQKSVQNAIRYIETLPYVSGQRIGLVGFSRGAFLAVSVAASIQPVKAVVDFFGGGGGGVKPLDEEVQGFPPLLILHGEKDNIVPLRFAYTLEDAVKRAGGEVELHVYPNVGHGLSQEILPEAFKLMFKFLKRHLEE